MKLTQLPAPVLACVIAVQRLYPTTKVTPSVSRLELQAAAVLDIPHPAGGTVQVTILEGDLTPDGARSVWLSMQGVPFGKVRLVGSQAVAQRIRAVIEQSDGER